MEEKWTYGLAHDDGNIVYRYNDAEKAEDFIMQRYQDSDWVLDYDMCGVFSGDIPSKRISEEEAMKIIGK